MLSHVRLPILALSAACALVLPTFSQEDEEKAPEVGVQLLADTTHVRPKTSFHLAVRFTIPEEWHIYWENPGDSGVETEVSVKAPAGYRVGKTLYPGPERMVYPGDIVTYGYEREVVLFVPVVPPRKIESTEPVRFEVQADWLVCKVACFVGNATRTLELPVIADPAKADSLDTTANTAVLEKARAALPRPLWELAGVSHEWESEGEKHVVRVLVPGVDELEFFPFADTSLEFRARSTAKKAEAVEITLELATPYGDESPKLFAHGLLRAKRGESVRYHVMALAPKSEDSDPRIPPGEKKKR